MAQRIEKRMRAADVLAEAIENSDRQALWGRPQTAINVFRPLNSSVAEFRQALPAGMLSTCTLDGHAWARSVAANPSADLDLVVASILAASGEET